MKKASLRLGSNSRRCLRCSLTHYAHEPLPQGSTTSCFLLSEIAYVELIYELGQLF